MVQTENHIDQRTDNSWHREIRGAERLLICLAFLLIMGCHQNVKPFEPVKIIPPPPITQKAQITIPCKPIPEVYKTQRLAAGKREITVNKRGAIYLDMDSWDKLCYNQKILEYYVDELIHLIEHNNSEVK